MKSITKSKSTIKDIVKALAEVERGGIFSFAAETMKVALKKSRVTKEPTPAKYAFVTIQYAATVSLGNSYADAVNNRLEKEGKEREFEAKGTYCHFVSDNRLVMKHNERESYYLRVYPNLCHSFSTEMNVFDAEGNRITPAQWKRLREEYFDKPSDAENQGLEEPVIVRNYSLENVLWLKRGEVLIENGEAVKKGNKK
jgi:hypothetical protein